MIDDRPSHRHMASGDENMKRHHLVSGEHLCLCHAQRGASPSLAWPRLGCLEAHHGAGGGIRSSRSRCAGALQSSRGLHRALLECSTGAPRGTTWVESSHAIPVICPWVYHIDISRSSHQHHTQPQLAASATTHPRRSCARPGSDWPTTRYTRRVPG